MGAQGFELWISRQVIREYCVIVSRKMKDAGSYEPLRLISRVRQMEQQFLVADETSDSMNVLLGLISQYGIMGKSVHDCNIVATIKSAGITHLLTQNTADFSRYSTEGFVLLSVIP
jgi:predicted nucleic acid-binding protein